MSGERHPEGDVVRTHDYLAQHGEKLLENGYNIVPIRRGSKSPGFDGWEKSKPSRQQLREWLSNGFANAGVGIITRNTPAIDLDIRDEECALHMEAWVRKNLGGRLVRVGQAPKRLFVFRTDKPFRKMRSTLRHDPEWMEKHQIEVLCEGQQFVAYHLHPDIHRPYEWLDEWENPLDVKWLDLPVLNEDQVEGLFEEYERWCDAHGWIIVSKGRRASGSAAVARNPFVEDTHPVELSEDECRARVLLVPNPEDYEVWVNVGMALYHQSGGDDWGLEAWHEWSETADNYDAEALDTRWGKGFEIHGKQRAPITFRYIIKQAQEAVEKTALETRNKLYDMFAAAKDKKSWLEACALAKQAELDGLARHALALVAKESVDKIEGHKMPLPMVKKAIAFEPKGGEKTPGWAKEWVYDTSDDKFFHTEKKIIASKQGFDAMNDRHALTKADILEGKTQPTHSASELALNRFKIQTVQGRRYEPGRDAIFHDQDGVYTNTYSDIDIPEVPDQVLPRDKKNVQRVKDHIDHLLTVPAYRRMFLDWLSWVVQNPGKHANYAVLLQGVEGDGKSFFAEMMRAVMGVNNVKMLNAHIFESDFTDWSVGQCLACIEEVRIVKPTNKYEVINRIKPNITNNIIEVHPKGRPVYNAKNTTSYLFFSNHQDALPLDDDGRRFLVLFTQWQNKKLLDQFKANNPKYYQNLYAAIEESAGAIRQWLLEHEQADDFNPFGDAPWTQPKEKMIVRSKHEFLIAIEQFAAENRSAYITTDLIGSYGFEEMIAAMGLDRIAPKTYTSILQHAGYEDLGRVRVGDVRPYFWSRVPAQFQKVNTDGTTATDTMAITSYVQQRKREIDNDL